jgi:co-chaperonin GroES (HSP10)
MSIKPLGFYVLIEMEVVEEVSSGGIVLPGDLVNKEQDATSVGYVRAIGSTAYHGYPGCDPTEVATAYNAEPSQPADCWGLEIGQKIEYRKFEGKKSAVKGFENYRYIPDSHIIGAIDDE